MMDKSFLGVLEYDDLLHERMKNALRSEYFRRMKKVLKSELNERITIVVITTRAV